MLVCKFGGSSLADAEQFKKVKEIILADKNRRYVIPSAPGKRGDGDEKPGSVMSGSRRRSKGVLGVGPTGRGRFKTAEPTIWRDEDLDVPTFIRKNLSLDF